MNMDLPSHSPISFTAVTSWQNHAAARDSSSRCCVGSNSSLILCCHSFYCVKRKPCTLFKMSNGHEGSHWHVLQKTIEKIPPSELQQEASYDIWAAPEVFEYPNTDVSTVLYPFQPR